MSSLNIKYVVNHDLNREIEQTISKYKKHVDSLCFRDLTYLKTYTIDDKETIEADDALSLEIIGNKYKIWIHISYPAIFIEYGQLLDNHARNKTSSVYLSTNNSYMFPEKLITGIFSLNNIDKKACLSLGVIFNDDGTVYFSEIVQTLIKVNYKLSYDDADELIDYAPREEEDLSIISRILDKRKSLRKNHGSNEILEIYGKVIFNDDKPKIKVIYPTISRLMISEAMILYGDLLSNFTNTENIPVPYRVQENSSFNSNDFNYESMNQIYINYLKKKSMGKTYYSISPLEHNSLGLKSYLHATSPIRRYSDLLVNFQMNNFLNNKELMSKEEIKENIIKINLLSRQNINKYREDQKYCFNKWLNYNNSKTYNLVLLNWINERKNLSIIYFLDFYISSICYLKTKVKIKAGDIFSAKNIISEQSENPHFEVI